MKDNALIGKDAPLAKIPKTFPTKIDNTLTLGLDLGVGSCGQALVSNPNDKPKIHGIPNFPHSIAYLGVRAFDIPEQRSSTGKLELKNPGRRDKKHLRKTTRRKAWRMWETRRLLKDYSLLPSDYPTDEALWKKPPTRGENKTFDRWRDWHGNVSSSHAQEAGVWSWRVKGLDEKLAPLEFAAVLLHLAKHRGFRSNKKSESSDTEGGKVLKALKGNEERLRNYRTIGEMLLKDEAFQRRKRNREGNYSSVVLRADQEKEAKLIFASQRNFGNLLASEELETKFLALFNAQYPLQNSFLLLGECPFEKSESRGPRLAPSFELCRALQKLNALSLQLGDGTEIRLADHIDATSGGYDNFITSFPIHGTKGNSGRITWSDLRTILGIEDTVSFLDLPTPKKKANGKFESTSELENKDFITASSSNGTAKGTSLLYRAFGKDLWAEVYPGKIKLLDDIAFALSFFEQVENDHTDPKFWGVLNQLRSIDLPSNLLDVIAADLRSDQPTLNKFSGATSMSLVASRKLIPHLRNGLVYSEACTDVYGDHRDTDFSFSNITNPVVKSVVRECLKQVVHLIHETGRLPGSICVELSRDLGKSIRERNEMSSGIRERTDRKNANLKNLTKELGHSPSPDELLRYELWLEQGNTCPYSGETLGPIETVMGPDFEVDHILPRSRSLDNSYDNKVLVHRRWNQEKKNSTPFEFYKIGRGDSESEGWKRYRVVIAGIKGIRKHKRRNLLNTTFAENEIKMASRHLNDTRYIARLVTHYLQAFYEFAGEKPLREKGSKRRVFVQPGSLTALVRKSWGLENLKKDREGRRIGDKHHAIDALICALLSEGQRQFITRAEQKKRDALHYGFADFAKSYAEMEKVNDHNRIPRHVAPPWKTFRSDVVEALDLFTVSRRVNQKGRGALHKDKPLSRAQNEDGSSATYTRKSIISQEKNKSIPLLKKLSDLEKVKGIDDPKNHWLKVCLTEWIEKGSPLEEEGLPRDNRGAIIRKLKIDQGKKSGRTYPQGFVVGGDQVRLDVFSLTKENGTKTFFLVPVYTYHILNDSPPNRAIVANKEESDWDEITAEHQFEFSLWQNSRFEIRKKPSAKNPEGKHHIGLYRGSDRNTGAFMASVPDDYSEQFKISAKTGTLLFHKLETDRLGRESLVRNEKRTWRGRVVS